MSDYHLAQLNVGVLTGPLDSPGLADFAAMLIPVNALADAAPGFIWRLRADDDGAVIQAGHGNEPGLLVNLSVWQDLESLRAFTYRDGSHLDMLRRRREFFRKMDQPHLALWWIPAGHIPTEDEASARLGRLRNEGPGPDAFTFRQPYPAPAPSMA